MNIKKLVCLALSLSMIVALCACSGKTDSSTETTTQTKAVATETGAEQQEETTTVNVNEGKQEIEVDVLNYAQDSDIKNFNPFSVGSAALTKRGIYQTLIDYEDDGTVYGLLAKEWKQIDDYTWEVTLYDYIKDHDGVAFKASDAVYSLERLMESHSSYTGTIDEIKVVSDYVFDIKFDHVLQQGDFEYVGYYCYMITQESYEKSDDKMNSRAVGTGRYKFKEYIAGSRWTLERWDDYWQTDESQIHENQAANAKTINVYVIAETSQRVIALQEGTVDSVQMISSSDASYFEPGGESEEGFTLYKNKVTNIFHMVYNVSDESPFSDIRVRKAISLLIDLPTLTAALYDDDAEVLKALGGDNWTGFLEKWTEQDYYDYNREEAMKLLEEAGYPGGKGLKITLLGFKQETRIRCAQLIQSLLLAEGIEEVEVLTVPSAEADPIKNDPTQWDMCLNGISYAGYLPNLWKSWFATDVTTHGATLGFVNDDKLQELIQKCLELGGDTEENLDACHQYMIEQCYIYGICYGYDYSVSADWIETNWSYEMKNQFWSNKYYEH